MRFLPGILVGLATVGAAAASCALAGFDRVDEYVPTPDAGDAGDASDGGGAGTCGHASWPDPPSATLPGDAEFVVAIRSVDLSEGSKDPPIGFDLDGKCTCEGESTICVEKAKHCDGPNGIDDEAKSLFATISLGLKGFSSLDLSQHADQGFWSLLIRVRHYNGEADDDQVELDWLGTTGFEGQDAGMPAWNGGDTWSVSTDSLDLGDAGVPSIDAPLFFDSKAYVTGGVLVASLPSAPFRFAGSTSSIVLKMTAGFVVAKVVADPAVPNAFQLKDGVVSARWKLSDVFDTIASYRDDNGMPLCTDNFIYSVGKDNICKAADILSSIGSPTTPCDAISAGIGFQAFPAKLGSIVMPAASMPGCPDATNPANDSCPP